MRLATWPRLMGVKSYSSMVKLETVRCECTIPVPGRYSTREGCSVSSHAPAVPTRTPG
jgi:hypothetical protein